MWWQLYVCTLNYCRACKRNDSRQNRLRCKKSCDNLRRTERQKRTKSDDEIIIIIIINQFLTRQMPVSQVLRRFRDCWAVIRCRSARLYSPTIIAERGNRTRQLAKPMHYSDGCRSVGKPACAGVRKTRTKTDTILSPALSVVSDLCVGGG